MHELFISQFEYSHSLNQKLIEIFLANSDRINDQAVRLFSHILNAHRIWNDRIEKRASTIGVWDITPVHVWQKMDEVNFEESLSIIHNKDLKSVIAYKTSRGESFANTTMDILFHIINHSTHHRAQIAMEFRKSGIEPLVSDYIFYRRTLQ